MAVSVCFVFSRDRCDEHANVSDRTRAFARMFKREHGSVTVYFGRCACGFLCSACTPGALEHSLVTHIAYEQAEQIRIDAQIRADAGNTSGGTAVAKDKTRQSQ